MNKKALIAVLFSILLIGGGLYFFTNQKAIAPSQSDENAVVSSQNDASKQSKETAQDSATPSPTTEIDISTWKTYRNEEYGFEFKYPLQWGELIGGESTAGEDDVVSGSIFEIVCEEQEKCESFRIIAETPDYAFAGLIEAGYELYTGTADEKEKLDCAYAEIEVGCRMYTIEGRRGIVKYSHVAAAGDAHGLERVAFLETPNGKYGALNFSFWLPGFEETSVNSQKADGIYEEHVIDLLKNDQISTVSRERIELMDKILSTFKFTK